MENQIVEITTKNTGALTMGIIAVVFGVLALLFGWVPFLGLLAIPVAGIGLFIAFIGCILALIKKFKGLQMPLLGGFLCGIAFIIPIISTGGTSVVISGAAEEVAAEIEKAQEEAEKDVSKVEKSEQSR